MFTPACSQAANNFANPNSRAVKPSQIASKLDDEDCKESTEADRIIQNPQRALLPIAALER
jgi:hypothetical protein